MSPTESLLQHPPNRGQRRVAAAFLWAFALLLPSDAHAEAPCGKGQRIVVETTRPFNGEAKVANAMCEVLRGVLAQGSGETMPNPLIVQLVDKINGSPLNAQYVSPNLFGRSHAHVEVTRDLVNTFSQDELALVLGHETAHRLHWNTEIQTLLKALRRILTLAVGVLAWFVVSSRHVSRLESNKSGCRQARPSAARRWMPAAAGIGAAVLMAAAMTAALAGVSTYFEYSADAEGVRILEAAGWTPARAHSAFRSFLSRNGGQAAGSWLAVDRHPSDADRGRAIEQEALTSPQPPALER